jgi:protein-S-isoprenylcysteine O-methyltransferase Ste14
MPFHFYRFGNSYFDRRIGLVLIDIMTVYLRMKLIDFLYKVATGSKKVRNLLTPVGAIFFALFVTLFVLLALQLDQLLMLPRLISKPFNIILCLPILFLGLSLIGWSVMHFLKVKGTPVPFNPPPQLVATGPYAYARNPMLSGAFILLFGLGLLIGSISFTFIFTPLFVVLNVWELKAIEEPELAKRLGEDYLGYKNKTPMFIPNFRQKEN